MFPGRGLAAALVLVAAVLALGACGGGGGDAASTAETTQFSLSSPEYRKAQEAARKRAAAIASWLKAHGVRLPVCSHGFGETVLAVETPDNTPEEKNRRTIFVISGQAPHGKDFQGEADWSCH